MPRAADGGDDPQPQPQDRPPLSAPTMPYCTDDTGAAASPVPNSGGDNAQTAPKFSWSDFLKACGGCPDASKPPPDGQTNCREDVHHHEHYSGCPYIGPDRVDPPAAPKASRPGQGGKHRPRQGATEDCPRHPEVDTMEFRRSDGSLNEYGTGPH
jgi:hypothetical protein